MAKVTLATDMSAVSGILDRALIASKALEDKTADLHPDHGGRAIVAAMEDLAEVLVDNRLLAGVGVEGLTISAQPTPILTAFVALLEALAELDFSGPVEGAA